MPDPQVPMYYDLEDWKRAVYERKESPEAAVIVKECITEDEEKQVDEKGRKVTIAFSTSQVDRDGDVIRQRGIDLDNFKKNPVVLFAHGGGFFGGGDAASKLPIASSTKLFMNGNGTKSFSVDQFVPRDMPVVGELAEANFRMLTTKLPDSSKFIMNAASIGFRPKKFSERKLSDEERGEFFFASDFEVTEKLEHSIVPVPANPGALRAAKQAGIELAAVAQWAESILDNLGKGEEWHPNFTRAQLEKAWDISNGEKRTFLSAVFDKGVTPPNPELVEEIDRLIALEKGEDMKKIHGLDDQLKRFEFPEVDTKGAGGDAGDKGDKGTPPQKTAGELLVEKLDEVLGENRKTNQALAILLDKVKVEDAPAGDPPPAADLPADPPPADPPADATPPATPPADGDDPVVLSIEDDEPTGGDPPEDGKGADFAATLSKLATESLAELLNERGSAN